jgi:hypothetical protein
VPGKAPDIVIRLYFTFDAPLMPALPDNPNVGGGCGKTVGHGKDC